MKPSSLRPTSFWNRIVAWARASLLRRRFESDMDEEIRFHMDAHAATLVAQGVPASEAQRRARIAFGNTESSRHQIRATVGLSTLDELLGDVRFAARVLRKSPGFTVIAATSLALAIGANTAIFSVARFLLIERLGVPHAGELRALYHVDDKNSIFGMIWGVNDAGDDGRVHQYAFTYPVYQRMRHLAHQEGIELFAYKDIGVVNVAATSQAQATPAELVSGNFYQQMRTTPALGRGIQLSDDGAPGTGPVVVLSYNFWQSAFGGARDVVGKTIRIDTFPVTVVGVNAKGFTGAGSVQSSPGVFLPMSMMALLRDSLGPEKTLQSTKLGWISIMLRQPAGQTEAMLRERLSQNFHAAALATVSPGAGQSIPTLGIDDASRGAGSSSRVMRRPLYVLLGLVGCVLLVACANVANLMLARATVRQREISLRLALGAGRSRIFRQLLIESLVLAALGGVCGAALGWLGTRAAPSLLQATWDTTAVPVPFQWPVLALTAGITLLTGICFGLAPALQSTRTDVNTVLKLGAANSSRQRKAWTGKGLVAFQISLATLLVTGSVLFVRTLMKLSAIDPGFKPEGLLLFQVQPPDKQYPGLKSIALHTELLQRFAALPGVQGVTATAVPLITNMRWNTDLRFENEPRRDAAGAIGSVRTVNVDAVSSGFFQTMGIPLVAGRTFSDADTTTSPRVVIVNRAFARTYLRGKDPLGIRFTSDEDPINAAGPPIWYTIVGVCSDTLYADLRTAPGPIYFTDLLQAGVRTDGAQGATYLVRSSLKPATLAASLKRAALGVDADLPLMSIRTQVQQMRDISRQERLVATLTAGFGLLALALACVGIYGVMAYTVSQRTHEIGIRLALGAERGRVRRMVLREATWLSVTGITVGLGTALALAQVVKALLYQMHPRDPLSLAVAASLLLMVSLSASWLPAARAARLEPAIALRQH